MRLTQSALTFVVILGVGVLSGCASPTIYHWGSYEDIIYDSYQNSVSTPPSKQIETMEADIQRAKGRGLPVPPGFHAHLGYLYSELGNTQEAAKHFSIEKKNFPSSAKLMDRFLGRLQK